MRMRVAHPRFALDRRPWPGVLTVLAIVFIGSFLVYTELIVREIRAEAQVHSRMFALVQQGLLSLDPGADLKALVALQATISELGIPVIVRNAEGEPYAVANLPFTADLAQETGRERVEAFARELDRHNPPIVEPDVGTVHFGVPPIVLWIRWVPLLQVGAALVLLLVGLGLLRASVRAERERMWSVMARELAHQMGTPLSSLAGWVEILDLPAEERDGLIDPDRIAREIAADVERLQRVSRRFELIGQLPALEAVDPTDVLAELERYLKPRVPRLASGVVFRVRAKKGLPAVRANRVLLIWALENVVKNALDALAGRGGSIRIAAAAAGPGRLRFSVADTGPGIPAAIRGRIFDTGMTTKAGGWGVGLSLTRRIIEDLHGGRIVVRPRRSGGTLFEIEVPTVGAHDRDGRGGARPSGAGSPRAAAGY